MNPDLSPSMMFAAALHAGALLLSAHAMPPLGETEGGPGADARYLLQPYLIAPAPPEEDEQVAATPTARDPDGREPVASRCGETRGGSMGKPTAASTGRRYGVQGPQDNPDPHISRSTDVDRPVFFHPWFVGRSSAWGGNPEAPVMPWGRDDALGNDESGAQGNMWGAVIGASFGSPGAGIGLQRLCPTCGDSGRGVRLALGTTGGGATLTEHAGGLAWPRQPGE